MKNNFLINAGIIILPIIIGVIIYVLFYPRTILFNNFLFEVFPETEAFRHRLLGLTIKQDKFFIHSIPTALWAFSYMYTQSIILFPKFKLKLNKFLLFLNIFIILAIEILQRDNIKIVPGTFDGADLLLNISAIVLAISLYFYIKK